MDRWLDGTVVRLTLLLLIGGCCLIVAGTAGLAASPLLAVGLLVLAAAVRALGTAVASAGSGRYDAHGVVPGLWTGPALASGVTLLWLDATPGEVQALGGLIGLAGMVNYFLRPVYHLAYGVGQRLVEA